MIVAFCFGMLVGGLFVTMLLDFFCEIEWKVLE